MKTVVVLATGGTIAMKYDEQSQGLVPACSGEDLAMAIPGIEKIANLEFEQFSNIASPGMTPQNMWDLHERCEFHLSREEVAGVVVTHGTDTLEETSYFLDLTHISDKPIATTAAMRGAGDLSPDGPMNILCAVKAVVAPESVGKGVLVVMNERIFNPLDVTKTHSANPDTFQAPWWGPLGYVDLEKIEYRHAALKREKILPKKLVARVDLIKAMTGADTLGYIDFALSQGVKGIVLEGFGRGNLPPPVMEGITRAREKGVAVVVTTRTGAGRVLDVYGYPGSVTDSVRRGAVMGGETTAAKARLKLMLLLSKSPELAQSSQRLQEHFDN